MMDETIKGSAEVKQDGSYIINKHHQIVYADIGCEMVMDEQIERSLCYQEIHGRKEPCPTCPVKIKENVGGIRKLIYHEKWQCWVECTSLPIQWPNEGECMLLYVHRLLNPKRQMFIHLNENVRYDGLMEFDTSYDTYEILYHDEHKTTYETKGKLQQLIEQICFHQVYPEDQKAFLDFWNVSVMGLKVSKLGYLSEEFRLLGKDQEYHWFSFYINPGQKRLKENVYLCFIVNSDRKYLIGHKQMEDQLFQILDPLTGLYNTLSFQKQVKQYLAQHSDESFGMVCIDIEHFKLFNDWYGTKEGDKLLIYIANQIRHKVHHCGGIAARFGGDDFVMLLPRSQCVGSLLESEIITWMQNYDKDVKFLPAAGIYLIKDQTMSVTLMCDRAMLALDSVKGNYAQRVATYHTTMTQKLANNQEILFGVKRGLENHEFEIYYQPQCSARTKRIIGAEALVRWNHPSKGILPPSEFIPILESSGFISKLDYYVWEEVCRFQQDRMKRNLAIVPISVNVSRMDIYQYRIDQVFSELIATYGLHPKMIEIEITESVYTEDYQRLLDAVSELRTLGFTVLMDDFGSGYSSLNMLKDIEIDVLKIDMKFLEVTEYSALKSNGILESIIQIGKWLGLRLIAEGVETKEQMDNLLHLDCEYMQGYYFYKPMPKAEFQALLAKELLIDTRGILAKRLPTIGLHDLFHRDITSEAMLSNILGGIALYEIRDDHHLSIQMVNDSYYRMTGCNSVDLAERQDQIIKQVHPDDVDIVWGIFQRAQQSPTQEASGVFRRYRLNGEMMWMHLRAFYLRKQGNKKLFYGAVRDDTEMMKLQKDMLALINSIPGNIVELRVKDDKVISRRVVCGGLYEQYGMDKDAYKAFLESKDAISILPWKEKDHVIELMQSPKRWAKEGNMELQTIAPNGTVVWIEQHINDIGEEDGIKVYNQLWTDITRLKQQEEALKESQTVLQNILGIVASSTTSKMMAKENKENAAYLFAQSVPGGMIGGYCEAGFPLYFANDEIIKLMGYDSYQDMYDHIDGLVEHTIHPDDRASVAKDIGGSFYEGLEYTTRYRMLCKDGSWLWVIDKGRVVQAEDGRLAIISCCIDITETTNTQMMLQEAREDVTLLNSLVPGGYHQCYQTPEFDLRTVSDRFLSMLGFSREDLQTRFQMKYLYMVVPEDREKLTKVDDIKNQSDDLFVAEYRIYTNNGTMWVRDQTRLIQHQQESYYAGIIEDIDDLIHMQEKIEAIVANTPGDVFSFEGMKFTYHSYNLAKVMGYEYEEYKQLIIGTKGSYFTDPRDRKMVKDAVAHAIKEQKDLDIVFRSLAKDHSTRYIHMKATYCGMSSYGALYYGIMIDATATILKDQELKISQQMFDSIIHQAAIDVWEYDVKKDRLSMSKEALRQISEVIPPTMVEVHGNYLLDHFMEQMEHKERFLPKTYHLLSLLQENLQQEDVSETIVDLSVYDEKKLWLKMTCERIYDDEGQFVKSIGYFQDVSEQMEKEELALEEKKYAQFDSLTGIYNRRMGEILIQNALAQKQAQHWALLMIDLDDFKHINDRYGHIIGDHVLKMVASCIQKVIKMEEDVFCRLGGDEFLIFTHTNDLDALHELINDIQTSIKENGHGDQRIALSIGIALAPQHGSDFYDLYRHADKALYEAKTKGKHQSCIYEQSFDKD